jgi:hypothetical protein
MAKPRKLLISALLLLVAASAAMLLWVRSSRAPEAARLLPEGNIILYANLKPAHLWDLSKSSPVQLEGDYRDFVEQTGIQFERDLDEVAMSRRDTPDGKDTESSEIFAGQFDQQRLRNYLEKISSEHATYHDHVIYSIPHEGHTVRVSILDPARVAVTNMASSGPIQGMIDSSFDVPAGPSLLREYYRRVPVTALGWMIARTPEGGNAPQLPNGWSFDFLRNTVSVASVRYQGDVQLQADVIAANDDEAARIVDQANTFLSVSRSIGQSLGARGPDPDVKAAFDSIHAQQNKNVAVFTATLSQRMLKKLVSAARPESAAPSPSPSPSVSQRKRHRR